MEPTQSLTKSKQVNWICQSKCPNLIALNIETVEVAKDIIEFRCLYCLKRAAYKGNTVDTHTIWRRFGGNLLERK